MTRYSKALVAIATGIAQVIALGLVEGDTALWLMVALAMLGSLGVYAVPNRPPAGEPADPAISEQHPTPTYRTGERGHVGPTETILVLLLIAAIVVIVL